MDKTFRHNRLDLDNVPEEIFTELKEYYSVLNLDNYGVIDENVRSQKLKFRKVIEQNIPMDVVVLDSQTFMPIKKHYEKASSFQTYIVRGIHVGEKFEIRSIIESGIVVDDA